MERNSYSCKNVQTDWTVNPKKKTTIFIKHSKLPDSWIYKKRLWNSSKLVEIKTLEINICFATSCELAQGLEIEVSS